jgi:uroporphyrinogen decarboxylase
MSEITPRECVWQSIRHQQPDHIPWHFGCTIPTRIKLENYYGTTNLDEALDQHIVKIRARLYGKEISPGFYQDEFGVVWNRTIDKDIGNVVEYIIKERSLKGVAFPDPHNPARLQALSAFIDKNPNRFRLVSIGFSLFERAWSLYGMANLMMDMLEEPAFVDELFDAILEYHLAVLDDVLKFDIDAVQFGDDWGQQTGLLFGPRLWRRFIKPRIAQLYSVTKKAGKAVFIHSCGKVQELFPELIELGLDVFNPLQPEVMDPYEIKKQYGSQLSFYGGVSIQRLLPFGTPKQIRDEVHKLIDNVGLGGGYIISPSHEMPGDIPIENLVAFIDAVREQQGAVVS